ncbi:hypothetical protein B0H16DRAFT_1576337 [Mycena metata]|uniref:Uncharacterized protein n=1 Tax=Mycena metata TaxID=1033252 RepID=A0AAD7MWN4_9AGAR|nr:hypothetical protein B0H16DRAFT_1576337 [Mycena metata]
MLSKQTFSSLLGFVAALRLQKDSRPHVTVVVAATCTFEAGPFSNLVHLFFRLRTHRAQTEPRHTLTLCENTLTVAG